MKKILLLTLVIIIGFAVTVYGTYGYFDATKKTNYVNINIGEWKAVVGNVMDYLNNSDTNVNNGGEEVSFLKEIAELIWTGNQYDENGKIQSGTLNERFQGYTNEQLKSVIDSALGYVKNYLQVDANGDISYPNDTSGVQTQVLPYNTPLAAGQSIQIPSAILTADLETSTYNSWEPMTYYISMESSIGADISDYALEVLYAPPFSMPDAFNYAFRFSDTSSYNQYGTSLTVSRDNIVFYPVVGQNYTTEVMRNNGNNTYVSTLYQHTLIAPPSQEYIDANGNPATRMWSRFTGLNMIMSAPKGSPSGNQQIFEPAPGNTTREGLILMGKPNGGVTELRISIFSRNINYAAIGIIPLLFNVSRGVALDSNNNPINAGDPTDVFPTIKVRAIKGYIA